MKKLLLIAVAVLSVGFGVGRVLYGRWVGSPAFKTEAEAMLTNMANSYAPGASVTIGRSAAAGLTAIELGNVNVKFKNHTLTYQQIVIKPGYLAAALSKSLPFSVDAVAKGGGALSAVGSIDRQAYSDLDVNALQLKCNLLNINAVGLINAKFGTDKAQKARLIDGSLSGQLTVSYQKRAGAMGSFDGTLQNIEWQFGQLGDRKIKMGTTKLQFKFDRTTATLTAPFDLQTALGRLAITGSMSYQQGTRWDVTVDPQNNPILRIAAANLFRCGSVPGTGTFKVTGASSAPNCQ